MKRKKHEQTQMEAITMIFKLWGWLLRKNPIVFTPLTGYLLFGGGVFAYQYFSADKFTLQEAKPISEQIQFDIMPKAYAGQDGPWIVFNGQKYAVEDTNYAIKKVSGDDILLVWDKRAGRVWKMAFDSGIKRMMK